jgi:hypothetical protein
MIILRRATTKKQRTHSIAETNITFFPPPKFTRTSTTPPPFLRVATQQSQDRVNSINTNTSMACSPGRNLVPSPPWRPSIEKKCAQSCNSVGAGPATIDVMVYPVEDPTATEQSGRPGHRRFSTEIISQGSIHEIMWDEKAISGESSSSSSSISRQPITNNKHRVSSQPRKQSIAAKRS